METTKRSCASRRGECAIRRTAGAAPSAAPHRSSRADVVAQRVEAAADAKVPNPRIGRQPDGGAGTRAATRPTVTFRRAPSPWAIRTPRTSIYMSDIGAYLPLRDRETCQGTHYPGSIQERGRPPLFQAQPLAAELPSGLACDTSLERSWSMDALERLRAIGKRPVVARIGGFRPEEGVRSWFGGRFCAPEHAERP